MKLKASFTGIMFGVFRTPTCQARATLKVQTDTWLATATSHQILWTQAQILPPQIGYLLQTPLSSFLPILALPLSLSPQLRFWQAVITNKTQLPGSATAGFGQGFPMNWSWDWEVMLLCLCVKPCPPCMKAAGSNVCCKKGAKKEIETSTIMFIVGSVLIVSIVP